MNILHMKYAVEVAKAGSINKASEALMIAQPNLSRAIKELESDLGITIFDRSAKGMFLTHDGEEFIGYAEKILDRIAEVETIYKGGIPAGQRFSVAVPRASYISDAFAHFSAELGGGPLEVMYKETNAANVIERVLRSDYRLGIVRYAQDHDKYYKELFDEKGLSYELVSEFSHVLLMNEKSPLAAKEEIFRSDLSSLIEIAHADPSIPSLPVSDILSGEKSVDSLRRIYVFERASQFELLSENPETFMWVSPIPEKMLTRYGLMQRSCADRRRVFKDMLIYRRDYRLTKADKSFITELCASRRRCFG